MKRIATLVALCGCSAIPEQRPIDAPPGVQDARPTDDAAPIGDAGSMTMNVPCDKSWTRTVRAPDNSRTETTTSYSLFDDIGPFDDFSVESCGVTYTPPLDTCPAGYMCTTTAGTDPGATAACSFAHRAGQFIAGKLFISCGYLTKNFNAQGAQTSESGYRYNLLRVYRE